MRCRSFDGGFACGQWDELEARYEPRELDGLGDGTKSGDGSTLAHMSKQEEQPKPDKIGVKMELRSLTASGGIKRKRVASVDRPDSKRGSSKKKG